MRLTIIYYSWSIQEDARVVELQAALHPRVEQLRGKSRQMVV